MSTSYYADRANWYRLHQQHPDWSQAELARVLHRWEGWVKKWLPRFAEELAAGHPLQQVLQGHSRARKHPPKRTEAVVVQQVLAIRDAPPEGLRRVAGPEAIRYYLQRDPFVQMFQLPVPSRRTIHRLLQAHGRIAHPKKRVHEPMERPAPLSQWQIDFKDVESVPAEPDGKQQHVVETLTIIDMGTSVLLDAHVRSDFTAESALQALSATLRTYGRPTSITVDRDPRLSWAVLGAVLFRRPCSALGPVWASRSTSAIPIIPNRMPLSNAFIAALKRNVWLWIGLLPWKRPEA